MSRTFGTAKATDRYRRAMAEAKLLHLRNTGRSIDEAAKALHEALYYDGKEDNFLKGKALRQLAKRVDTELIIEYMLLQEHLTEQQLVMCRRVHELVRQIRVAPPEAYATVNESQLERTDGFQIRQILIWGECSGVRSFFKWEVRLNDYYTKETPDVAPVSCPDLAIIVKEDDQGRPSVWCDFGYGTYTNGTFHVLMLTAGRRDQIREGFFYPETAPPELLANFDDFMTRLEAVSDRF